MTEFLSFDSRETLSEQLADDVAKQLTQAVSDHGTASLIVSGGSTPKPFFQTLKQMDLPWNKITITLADERWVLPNSDESTEKLVRENLLHADATFISMSPINENESLSDGVERINQSLQSINQPFNVVILGMGEDGHTASLFPNHDSNNYDGDALCLAVDDSPKPPPQRITLTPNTILSARHLIIHITGDGKKDMYDMAVKSGDKMTYPIAAFIPTATTYWAA